MGQKEEKPSNLVEITIGSITYSVPDTMTVMQAHEYAGYRFTKGCGCRGGVCGACSMIYRLPESYEVRTGLACQTKVEAGMQIIQIPAFPMNKARYELEELSGSSSEVLMLYPEVVQCMGCNTCTKSCPMEINVMHGVSGVLRDDVRAVAEETVNCVMCGLCSARCPAGLTPHFYFLLCRRLNGRHIMAPFIDVPPRIDEIESEKYRDEMDKIVKLDMDTLREMYRSAQADKRVI